MGKFDRVEYIRLLRRNPDFARLWSAQAISLMGDWFNSIVLYALVSRLSGGSGLAITLLLLARFVPPLLVSPLAGVLLDRFNRKHLLILSDVMRIFIVLAYLFVQSPEHLWLIYALTTAQFVFSALFEPGRSALLPSVVQPDDLVKANILSSVTWSVSLAIGGALGGFISATLGTAFALVFDAATFAVSAFLITRIRADLQDTSASVQAMPLNEISPPALHSGVRDFREGLQYVRARPSLAAALLIKAGGTFGNADTILIIYATLIFVVGQDGTGSLGVLWSAFGFGAVFGPIIFNRFSDGSVRMMRRLILVAFILLTLSWFFLGAAPALGFAAAALFLRAMGSSVYWTYSSVIVQKSTEDAYLGRVFSLEQAAFQLMVVISALGMGALLEAFGTGAVRPIVFAVGVASFIPLLLWSWALPRLERMEKGTAFKTACEAQYAASGD